MNSGFHPGIQALNDVDASGQRREYLLFVPDGTVRGLVVLFHPFGSRPELVLNGGTDGDYLIRPLTGAALAADRLGLAVLAPRSRGRQLDGVSLAWRDHLDAVWEFCQSLKQDFGLQTMATGGLSMGGLEALVFAGQHPEGVAAAWAANPIVDLDRWWRDLSGSNPHEPGSLAELIATEVGATPDGAPAEYIARSPLGWIDGLRRVKVLLAWSPEDTVIPNQGTAHAHQLANRLREHGGTVVETVVTHTSTDDVMDAGRFAHEACDVREGMGWLAEMLTP